VLRDQGVSYQAYISQISYLLFLKMDEERVEQIGEASMLPDGARWADIKELSGDALGTTYGKLLEMLSKQPGIIRQGVRPFHCQRCRTPEDDPPMVSSGRSRMKLSTRPATIPRGLGRGRHGQP
jgi:hypothetical protein